MSSTTLQPIQIWGKGGPNPPKVAVAVAELGLPHEIIPIPLSKVKEPEYTAINPNGRIPAIYDPNTDLTLWESGAIVEYLVERYDTKHLVSFPTGSKESYLARQWLYFQVSGQGPYFGQASWFKKFHPEKVPSAVERYVKEINRVTGVLEGHLKRQKEDAAVSGEGNGPWLVGNKYSFADFSFLSWQTIVTRVITKEDGFDPEQFPVVQDWVGRILERDAVKKVFGDVEPVV
ncbi:putative glutathione S-transferase [Lophiostoma macrostomum CBS 122681]|uniref:Putative glutathione S-transferase n=1 Tax=Lophiostoma macrostomum CBS 122681 TaxID=1314788 RepID=A0A6A6SQ29_9PLEO|nr:putative glutathione S-transferase [Lophiostoma macrostomum CBS 122681]